MTSWWNPGCWLTRRRLSAFCDGEVGTAQGLRIEAHLERCSGCSAEFDGLNRLRRWLKEPERPEMAVPAATWDTFWPGVRARLADVPALSARRPWLVRLWEPVAGHPRLALGSALAATAIAVLAISPAWQVALQAPAPSRSASPGPPVVGNPGEPPTTSPVAGRENPPGVPGVVVHSLESADPQSNVMVFANPESDMTVVWVFGLPRTGT